MPFELGGVLGRGGMGEVRIGHDPRLEREVAIKTVAPGDAVAAARLAREARLTARLEHPGIMPVYEAGRGEDGRPWYAMRLFVGRTLADALVAAPSLVERLRLVRHVMDAAYAVAYAHEQGILHRDLTPRNVITGQFGETIVADWGLACTREEARASEPGVGSPGFASPEQTAGGPIDERADVYGLGALLAAVLAGAGAPQDGAAGGQAPAGAAGVPATNGAGAAARGAAPPPELLAIAERARRPDPAGRYPSARAFADDLLAWFEGRRVDAHTYTPGELLRRLVLAWRIPLLVAAGGLVAVGAAAAVGYASTAEERARAEASEEAAAVAEAAEQRAFAGALRVQAGLAASEGLALEAEVLAAHAIRRDDTPEARGVLAAASGRPRWERLRSFPGPRCQRRLLSLDGERIACATDAAVQVVDATSGAVLREVTGAFARAALLDGEGRVLLLDQLGGVRLWDDAGVSLPLLLGGSLATGVSRAPPPGGAALAGTLGEIVIDTRGRTAAQTFRCGDGQPTGAVALTADGRVVAACHDGRVIRDDAGGGRSVFATVPAELGVPHFVEVLDGGRILLGTATGWVVVYREDGAVLGRRRLGDDAPFTAAARGERVAVGIASGGLYVWDLAVDAIVMRFRGQSLQPAWLPDGSLRVLGQDVADYAAPADAWPHRVTVGAGVGALAWSPDGESVAFGGADGVVSLYAPRTGALRTALRIGGEVVKDVTFSPDGAHLLVASAGKTQVVAALPSGERVLTGEGFPARRAVWLGRHGALLGLYALEQARADLLAGRFVLAPGPGFADLEADTARTRAAGIERDGTVYLADDGATLVWRATRAYPTATAIAAEGGDAWIAMSDALVRVTAEGAEPWRVSLPPGSTELAISPDARWAAVGYIDGSTLLYAVGEDRPRARFVGHRARISALGFSPDGRWLTSGAWDGDVRLWSIAALEADPATVAQAVEDAWGARLDDVLGAVALPEPR